MDTAQRGRVALEGRRGACAVDTYDTYDRLMLDPGLRGVLILILISLRQGRQLC